MTEPINIYYHLLKLYHQGRVPHADFMRLTAREGDYAEKEARRAEVRGIIDRNRRADELADLPLL